MMLTCKADSIRVTLLSLSLAALFGCANPNAMDQMDDDPAQMLPALGEPLMAPAKMWTWIDFPDSVCDDGSPTGIGVNLSCRAPASARMVGRTTWTNVTKLATGLPGSPMKGVPPMIPIATGRPGLIAIRHNTSFPALSTAALT